MFRNSITKRMSVNASKCRTKLLSLSALMMKNISLCVIPMRNLYRNALLYAAICLLIKKALLSSKKARVRREKGAQLLRLQLDIISRSKTSLQVQLETHTQTMCIIYQAFFMCAFMTRYGKRKCSSELFSFGRSSPSVICNGKKNVKRGGELKRGSGVTNAIQ